MVVFAVGVVVVGFDGIVACVVELVVSVIIAFVVFANGIVK